MSTSTGLRRLGGVALALAALALALAPATANAEQDFLSTISGPTLFADCPAPAGTSLDFPLEPHIARNPVRPNNLVAAYQQDRSLGGSRGAMVAYSNNGGRSWERMKLPDMNTCDSAAQATADQWVTFDAAGTAYVNSQRGYDPAANVTSDVLVNRSTDGGRTWSAAKVVQVNDGIYDKNTITADPRRVGVLYVAWANIARDRSRQDIYVTRSDDGGDTWSEPKLVLPGVGVRAFPGRILVAPDHSVTVIAEVRPFGGLCTNTTPVQVVSVRSTDEGETWGAPSSIGSFTASCPAPLDEAKRVHGGFGEASEIGPDGRMYVTFSPEGALTASSASSVTLATSDDNGATWQSRTIAQLPTAALQPQVAVDDDGRVGVSWYDFRSDQPGDGQITTDHVLATADSADGVFEQKSLASFDSQNVPSFSPGVPIPIAFLGDYQGIVGLKKGFGVTFTAGPPFTDVGPTSIQFAHER